jgi:anti-sigma factor RsiW
MICCESEVLVHALIDGELDAGHARELEAHLDGCPRCASLLRACRKLRQALSAAPLRLTAPPALRQRLETVLSAATTRIVTRRSALRSVIMGSALSAALAATLVVAVMRPDHEQRLFGELITAHVRSLQGGHLTDVRTSDQHTVKPWFNGKVAMAPPVVDLAAQGFPLIGGRLDYIDGKAVASIVYRRQAHVINLFVAPAAAEERRQAELVTIQGFNIRCWVAQGLEFFAVSDVAAEELQKFRGGFEAARGQV